MYKKVIYVVNEVKGVTEGLRTSVDYNVVRDYAGNGKSFIKVSLTQDDVPTTIITQNHRFESKQIEVTGGNAPKATNSFTIYLNPIILFMGD